MSYKLFFIFLMLSILSCSKKISSDYIQSYEDLESVGNRTEEAFEIDKACTMAEYYAPDEDFPEYYGTRKIRVNFHIMNDTKGDKNFKPGEAQKFLKSMLRNANQRLMENKKLNLPVGNDIPNWPPYYQCVITPNTQDPDDDGFYFHADDELYYFINKGKNRNNYKREVIKKYSVNADSILNVFVMPHHPDSVASKTYKQKSTGISLGTSIKISGIYERSKKPWQVSTLFNHEVGHSLGLSHAWTKHDGCDDTPAHPNCYSRTETGECSGVSSNNLMDYNNSQMALSPCQLGRIHRNIARENSLQRKLTIADWCDYQNVPYVVDDDVDWFAAKDINRDIIIKDGARLTMYCRVSMAKAARIIVEPGGELVLNDCRLHNDCGDKWGGIEIQKAGKKVGLVSYFGNVSIEDLENDLTEQ